MKFNKSAIAICVPQFLLLANLFSQQSVLTSGGNSTSTGGVVNYSVGQVFYTNISAVDGIIAQGVQLPYEISVTTGITETQINLSVSAYPNPTIGNITLSIYKTNLDNLSYQLFDMNGKLLKFNKLQEFETTIEMNDFVPAPYVLKVTQNEKEIKSYKIIKNLSP